MKICRKGIALGLGLTLSIAPTADLVAQADTASSISHQISLLVARNVAPRLRPVAIPPGVTPLIPEMDIGSDTADSSGKRIRTKLESSQLAAAMGIAVTPIRGRMLQDSTGKQLLRGENPIKVLEISDPQITGDSARVHVSVTTFTTRNSSRPGYLAPQGLSSYSYLLVRRNGVWEVVDVRVMRS